MSGRHSEATTLRARELRVEDGAPGAWAPEARGVGRAAGAAGDRRGTRSRSWATTWPICRSCRRVGLPIAVANAVPEVKAVAAYVTRAAAATARCARSVEALLKARGEWDRAARALLRGAGDPCRLIAAALVAARPPGASTLEAAAVSAAATRLDDRFARAVELLADASGRVIVSGVGKSGLIARKIAATLTSTGTAGDLPASGATRCTATSGWSDERDVAIVLSKSGESEELFGSGRGRCSGCRRADHRDHRRPWTRRWPGRPRWCSTRAVAEEACPHDLAPTASTTVALALGDALAVALLEVKGFRREDFARAPSRRPARAGRLLLRVRDVMLHPGHVLGPDATMRDAVVSLAHDRGLALVVDGGRLAGVLTAATSPAWPRADPEFLELAVSDVMTRSAKDRGAGRARRGGGRHHGAARHHRPAGRRQRWKRSRARCTCTI